MAYEQKDGQGALFVNDKKTSETQPDYTGNVMLDGQKKRLAAWEKEGRTGVKYLSVQVSEFRQGQDGGETPF